MQAWSPTLQLAAKAVFLLVAIAVLTWWGILALRRNERPIVLIFKWVLTALVLWWMNWQMDRVKGIDANLGRLWIGIAAAFILAATWRHSIADMFANPFGSVFDGGDQEIDAQPFYSVAEAKRKQGKYPEAVAEIRKQLKKFPTDFHGQMMLAAIQAEDLNDLPGAEVLIHRICSQPKHAPVNIAYALNMLADWHLKIELDRDAAQKDLQRIVDLLPDSDHALIAAQRIAHLSSSAQLVSAHDRHRPIVHEGLKNVGLLKPGQSPKLAEADSEGIAADYVRHLEANPLDFETREKLAVIYADHYRRMDLATEQLDQLIQMPGQSARNAIRWLNLLADLQIRHGAEYDIVQQTLERILNRYPLAPGAEIARSRLAHLKLEFKRRNSISTVKMGEYEQNIGLKERSPRH